jgi:hypothetical protein
MLKMKEEKKFIFRLYQENQMMQVILIQLITATAKRMSEWKIEATQV